MAQRPLFGWLSFLNLARISANADQVRDFAARQSPVARLARLRYEARLDVSEAMILVAMGGNLLRRTTHP